MFYEFPFYDNIRSLFYILFNIVIPCTLSKKAPTWEETNPTCRLISTLILFWRVEDHLHRRDILVENHSSTHRRWSNKGESKKIYIFRNHFIFFKVLCEPSLMHVKRSWPLYFHWCLGTSNLVIKYHICSICTFMLVQHKANKIIYNTPQKPWILTNHVWILTTFIS